MGQSGHNVTAVQCSAVQCSAAHRCIGHTKCSIRIQAYCRSTRFVGFKVRWMCVGVSVCHPSHHHHLSPPPSLARSISHRERKRERESLCSVRREKGGVNGGGARRHVPAQTAESGMGTTVFTVKFCIPSPGSLACRLLCPSSSPSSAKRCTIARPIPSVDAVTIATFPPNRLQPWSLPIRISLSAILSEITFNFLIPTCTMQWRRAHFCENVVEDRYKFRGYVRSRNCIFFIKINKID